MAYGFDDYDGCEDGGLATCKFCGTEDLHWFDWGGGMKLYNEDDKRHVCPQPVASTDDFDVV